ncbi:MAG TPA: hypothetical protein VKP30_31870 [Polyangiaceae bacterium]|nr:hypothetical protein [Polyangiaceae bacterium]
MRRQVLAIPIDLGLGRVQRSQASSVIHRAAARPKGNCQRVASFATGGAGGGGTSGASLGGHHVGDSKNQGGFGAADALAGAGTSVAGSHPGSDPVADCSECLAANARVGRGAAPRLCMSRYGC